MSGGASITTFTGLYNSVATFQAPPGSLQDCLNVVVRNRSLLEPRRGFAGYLTTNPTYPVSRTGFYQGRAVTIDYTNNILGSWNPDDGSNSSFAAIGRRVSDLNFTRPILSAYNPGGATADPQPPTYTDLSVQTKAHSKFFTANGNLYVTYANGLAVVNQTTVGDWTTSGWYPAGMPKPPNSFVDPWFGGGLATGTYLLNNYQASYRMIWSWTDPNGNEHLSAPSERCTINNTSGSSSGVWVTPARTDLLPVGAIAKAYRTKSTPISAIYRDVAGDENFDIWEKLQTSASLLNGYQNAFNTISVADNTPDIPWLVDPLYTNPVSGDENGLGVGNANNIPPICVDTFQFRDRYYYVNTEEQHRVEIQIIGTGTGGIQDGDTFFIAGNGFVFRANGLDIGPPGYTTIPLFYVGNSSYDTGAPTSNVEATAREIVLRGYGVGKIPNTGTTLSAWRIDYVSPPNGVPGQILIERLVPGAAQMTVTPGIGSGRGWAGSLNAVASDSNRQPANIMQSQPNDPESVPPAFSFSAGKLSAPILRGIALRDAAYLFKGNEDGLWKMTDDGTGAIAVTPSDQTVNLVAPETAVPINNSILALCDRGVLMVTDGGAPVNVTQERILRELLALMRRVGNNTLAEVAFAVPYESDRLYLLYLPESANATSCTLCYCLSLETGEWTKWRTGSVLHGSIDPTRDRLLLGMQNYFGGGLGTRLWFERKAKSDNDYQDPTDTTLTVPSSGTYTASSLVFSSSVAAIIKQGYILQDTYSAPHVTVARVTAVSADGKTITLDGTYSWTGGDTLTVLRGIPSFITFQPLVAGEPLVEKQWKEMFAYFNYSSVQTWNVGFSCERQQIPTVFPEGGSQEFSWYDNGGAWGSQPWGGAFQDDIVRSSVDKDNAHGAELTITLGAQDALTRWELSALRVTIAGHTENVTRGA